MSTSQPSLLNSIWILALAISPYATRLVRVVLDDGTELTGRISSVDEDAAGAVTLDVDGAAREVAYADVSKALVQIEFNRKSEES